MIAVTRLNSASILLNSDLIETVESTPDTVIGLTNGQKMVVLESAEEVLERVRLFRRSIAVTQCVACVTRPGSDRAPDLRR